MVVTWRIAYNIHTPCHLQSYHIISIKMLKRWVVKIHKLSRDIFIKFLLLKLLLNFFFLWGFYIFCNMLHFFFFFQNNTLKWHDNKFNLIDIEMLMWIGLCPFFNNKICISLFLIFNYCFQEHKINDTYCISVIKIIKHRSWLIETLRTW